FCTKGKGSERVKDLDTKRHPVEQVTYKEAVEFCRLLSALPAERNAGRVYRLPTEAEWEYACRAGSTTVFNRGNKLGAYVANFNYRKPYNATPPVPVDRTTQVGGWPRNTWGLYDMHGGVYEWTSDWYTPKLGRGAQTDPTGPERGKEKVIKGGSWGVEG